MAKIKSPKSRFYVCIRQAPGVKAVKSQNIYVPNLSLSEIVRVLTEADAKAAFGKIVRVPTEADAKAGAA